MADQKIVSMRSITKVYPDGTQALRGVDLEIEKGEIHGLLGENGAGKTTLAKILSGLLSPTTGDLLLNGNRKRFRRPSEALKSGVGMVHQHFTLVPTFDAVQNIVLGQEESGLFLNLATAKEKISSLINKTGLKVPLNQPIELMPVGVQQKVEILKLLYRDVQILILDEPTSVLTPLEVSSLFQMLQNLKTSGGTVIFITHKLREVLEITDTITVLRNGKVAGRPATREATGEKLAEMMVGMKTIPVITRQTKAGTNPVLEVIDLKVRNDFGGLAAKDISFQVRSGEIFGIAGVEGNGQMELVQALTGLRPTEAGRMLLNGSEISRMTPRQLYKTGLAHVPEDRRKLGLILDFNVAENSILGIQEEKRFRGKLDHLLWKRIFEYASELVKRFGIVTPSLIAKARNLSGGNQQRLVVARELVKTPQLMVVSQPTRGLDLAATHYIRELLLKLRDEKKAVLLVSADLDEVTQLSDRIAVMYEGQFMAVANSGELDRRTIGMLMGGVKPN